MQFIIRLISQACMRTCLADAQIRECGCADGQYAFENKPICDTLKDPKTGGYNISICST